MVAAREGFIHGFHTITLTGAALCAVGAVIAFLIVNEDDLRHEEG